MKRVALLASSAGAALLAGVGSASADPISLTAILATAITSVSGGAVAGGAATIAATIAAGAITVGAGYLLTSLFGPTPPKPENGTVAEQETVPYRPYAYGTCAPPGIILHKEAVGTQFGVVSCIAAHEIDDWIGLYFNDDQLTILQNNAGNVTGYSSTASDGRYKPGYVALDSRKGAPNQSWMGTMGPAFAQSWPSTSTGQGLALLMLVATNPPRSKANEFTTIFPYIDPKPRPIIHGAKVYDPRVAAQNPSDPTTWAWSDNAVLLLLHWRCFSEFGSKLPYGSAIAPNLAAWIEAANRCDDQVALKSGGNERRYRAGGWSTTEQDRRSTTAALLAACDGWMVDRGDGTVDIKVGVYYPPTVTLTDADIIGYQVQRDRATKDAINRVTARYTSPDNGFVSVETNPMDNTTDQALRFGPIRAAQMDLLWVQSTGQASRLQKREFIRQGRKTRGTLVLGLSGLNAAFERFVMVQSNTIPRLSGVVIEPSRPVIDILNQRVTISFVDSGPDIDTYDPQVDESPYPYVVTRPASAGLPVPANVQAVFLGAGALTVSWDAPIVGGTVNYTFSYIVQVRTAAVGSTAAGTWVQQEFVTPTGSGRISVTTSGGPTGPAGTELDVQVITESSSGQLGPPSNTVQVATS